MIEDDCCFFLFISLALLIVNKNNIMSIDRSMLPQTLSDLKIGSVEELKKIYQKYKKKKYFFFICFICFVI